VQVPYLIDANTGAAMYESDDILRYLNKTYAL
jgi:glutathione S-transferase